MVYICPEWKREGQQEQKKKGSDGAIELNKDTGCDKCEK